MKELLYTILTFCAVECYAQFPPAAGSPGSTAIHKDSIQWATWADACTVQRGYLNISNPGMGFVNSGMESDATGPAGEGGVLSLGDGGTAILSFPYPIRNGLGPDFAVFENAFNNTFLELAFVEVSSDGINFVRFPAISNTDTSVQIGTFGAVDATKIHNLAGKYRSGYGTPFDLEELKDSAAIDIENITHVRIIDVVGSIAPEYCSRDSRGIIINDPWSTPFNEGGFDLDGIGVIHASGLSAANQNKAPELNIYPNPFRDYFSIKTDENTFFEVFNLQGQLMFSGMSEAVTAVPCAEWPSGVYVLKVGGKVEKVQKN
jgi:hypothetical protein